MNPAVLTLLLALGWAAATGNFSLPNLLFGGLVGGFCVFLIRGQVGGRKFLVRSLRVAALALLFLQELILSALRVAALVLRPKLEIKPGFVAYPLTVTTDIEIALLANLITLTPGTLSVDVSTDRKHLLIHVIDLEDRDALIASIRDGLEAKVLEASR